MSLDHDIIARIYDELYGDEQRKKYETIIKRVRLSGLLLDAGCGTGALMDALDVDENRYYVGIDISRKMIAVAKKRLNRIVKGDLLIGDINLAPFRNKVFDIIVSFTVIHEAPKSLSSFFRVIKDRGLMVVSVLRKRKELLSEILYNTEKEIKGNYRIIDEEDVKDLFIIWNINDKKGPVV
ncbi:MAG: hypothetical protein DRJ64_10735 [Thermoprotei archaeon]|nr:MAG: hypothetical protein DRJ64_10735 [Thermoprotei archaeon]